MKIPQSYKKPLVIAIGLHVMLAIILIVKLPSWSYQYNSGHKQASIVHATAITPNQVQQAMQHINNQEHAREREERQQVAALRAQAKREAQRQQQAALRVAKLKQEQLHLKQQHDQQVKALAVLKQKQIKMAQIVKQHAVQIKKAQAIAKAQQSKAQAIVKAQQSKAQALAKQHKELLLQKQQQLQQQLLAQQLAGDSNQLKQIQINQMRGMIDKYKAMILSAIGQNWLVPGNVDKNLSSVFEVQLAPGGVVLSVTLVKSSGNDVLDQSAQTAIYKTSPLPVPKDPVEFDNFRDLRLTVSPKEVIHS